VVCGCVSRLPDLAVVPCQIDMATARPGLILMVPCPTCDGWVVLAEFPRVATSIQPGVDHPLSKLSGMIAQPVDAVDDIHDKVKPV
jgi:hypothetical protein